ncbi:DUF1828 domain-containing protein [Secundilactobacillus muriivasis]
MLTGKELSEEYYTWIKNNTVFKELDDGVTRVDVPFVDNSSDEIVMYIIQKDDGHIALTDDGWTLDNLEGKGVYISRSAKRRRILEQQLKSYGVSCEDDELFINTTLEKFPESKHRLLQAILFVNDMFMLAPSVASNVFFEDISTYFSAHNIRTSKNMSYVGASGLTHKYEFSIPGIDSVPMKLIKTMATPNNSMFAKSILADVEQTRPVLSDPGVFYVFLNNRNPKKDNETVKVNPDIMNLFKMNDIKPILYSDREEYAPELAK